MRRLALFLLALVVAAGCGFNPFDDRPLPDDRIDMSESSLVGTWQKGSSAITFAADGRFAATGLPPDMFRDFPGVLPSGFDPARDVVTASGTWSLEAPLADDQGPHNTIELHTEEVMGRANRGSYSLRAEGPADAPVLALYLSDPDLHNPFVYQKCQTACVAVTPQPSPS